MLRGLAIQAMKASAAATDLVRSRPSGLTVLIYHRVGGPGGSVDLDPGRFDEQVAELAESGRVRTLAAGVAELDRPSAAPVDAVALTFDDGTVDFVEQALPILVRHRVPALLYLATQFADEGLDFPGGGPAISWAGLRDAIDTGLVEVGSHTHTHALLDRLAPAAIPHELDRSIGLIEDHLGRRPHHFAYPKAVLGSPEARAEVAARFQTAAVAGTRPNRPGSTDLQQLARTPIQVADGMRWFRRKAAGGMQLEDDLRRRINRRRYAGAAT